MEEYLMQQIKDLLGWEDFTITVDQPDDNHIIVRLEKIEQDNAKKEFENWVDQLDDEIFESVYNALAEEYSLHTLNDMYESENYSEIVKLFKNKAKELVEKKIQELSKILEQ